MPYAALRWAGSDVYFARMHMKALLWIGVAMVICWGVLWLGIKLAVAAIHGLLFLGLVLIGFALLRR